VSRIQTRFDLWPSAANKDQRVTIARANIPQVPEVGETINLNGDPHIIHRRGWALDDDGQLFAYVDVFMVGRS